jgi:putative SOS response-associated peptidase YedK
MEFDDACGDFAVVISSDDMQRHYKLPVEPDISFKSYNTRPTHSSPVVIADADGKPKLEIMKWGFELERKTPPHKMLLFNTRDDSAFKSPFWKSKILTKRALIPASGYFEWTKTTPKRKYYYHPMQISMFSFAGLFGEWKDSNGKDIKVFSILTTEPNKEAATVHNRMPVILRKEDEASYLDPSKTEQKDIEPFLHPYEDDALKVVEVSNNTRDFASDDKGLIAPLNSV